MRPRIYPSILVASATTGASVLLMTWRPTLGLGVALMSCLSIAVFFYNLVWQYRKVDRLIGGKPEALCLYWSAFALLLSGYLSVATWFFSREGWAGLVGGFLIVIGILLAQGSNALLLDHFIHGRRWRLAEPLGSGG